jgi:hypothetical protein
VSLKKKNKKKNITKFLGRGREKTLSRVTILQYPNFPDLKKIYKAHKKTANYGLFLQ